MSRKTGDPFIAGLEHSLQLDGVSVDAQTLHIVARHAGKVCAACKREIPVREPAIAFKRTGHVRGLRFGEHKMEYSCKNRGECHKRVAKLKRDRPVRTKRSDEVALLKAIVIL